MFSLNPPWTAFKTPMYKKKVFNLPPKTLCVQSEKAWGEDRKQKILKMNLDIIEA